MARLPLIVQSVRRKRIGLAVTIWLQMCTVASWFLVALGAIHSPHTYRPKIRSYVLDFYAKRDYVKRLVYASDETCIEQVRMNRIAFFKLCEMLQTLGGLKSSRNMLVDEQMAMFLHIISHHLKNRVIKHHFNRSGETVSRSFHNVLNAVIRLQDVLFKKAEPITANSTDPMWKWFKNCLGALDGTHIKIRVPTVDKPRYRMRKGDIATNMLGVCTPDMHFVYVLPGWEGSVTDGRVLRDAISRRHGLKVPHGCYYLVDAGYTNCEGFLAPFRGQRYHLNEWRQGYQPSTPEEFFNMKHASARNVIERCFGLLKIRWGILRSPSFYPVRVHNRIIIACCLLHNFIRTYMSIDPIEEELGEGLPSNVIDEDEPNIIVMSGFSQSNVSSQSSRGTKRKWVPEEDAALVACMVDLHNAGTYNADTGFKAGYLNELEKMLEKVLPNAMLKAKPNLESRIRTLKRDCKHDSFSSHEEYDGKSVASGSRSSNSRYRRKMIHDVPVGLFSGNLAMQLGNFLGNFLEYDTANLGKDNRNFMCKRVEIDIRHPLKQKKQISFGERRSYVYFKYKRLSLFCFYCGRLGHSDSFCEAKMTFEVDVAEMGWDLSLQA
ncbi:hypothetical protein J1N35_026251 [Gossypium stocksii]|uniref:CCHC-type domain-containing protein n=1 Tax=Gossypium stocksii TaxID=47602 RepID=A0A9D3ZZ24_9ROSI|nr:hypothetical protein J1N35_026251 [Gossypium stocksii]